MSAQKLRPESVPGRPVLITNAYPFVRARSRVDVTVAALEMKLMVLLGWQPTFAGSTLLLDDRAKQLFYALQPLFRSGYIIPDLRKGADSFVHLAELRRGGTPEKELISFATELDSSIPSVIEFEPEEVSGIYRTHLGQYLETAQDGVGEPVAETIASVRDALLETTGPLTLADAKALGSTLPGELGWKRMADFLYCVSGAEVVRSDAILPRTFAREEAFGSQRFHTSSASPIVEMHALRTLLKVFAIDVDLLSILSPQSIISLTEDARVQQAVEELRRISETALDDVEGQPITSERNLSEIVTALQAVIVERSRVEIARERRFRGASDTLVDLAMGAIVPVPVIGPKLLQHGMMVLERRLARSKRFRFMAKSFTPMLTFASLLRAELIGQQIAAERLP